MPTLAIVDLSVFCLRYPLQIPYNIESLLFEQFVNKSVSKFFTDLPVYQTQNTK